MAIHCHSARYHYDSFHNRGGDIINIGSNNTYNFGSCGFGSSIWGNGGNFWGGFGTSLGWGLGQGLMNWLGNGLSGGGWNPAGIFGGYNMGYGMNPWQQMSTYSWGGSTGGDRSTSGTDSSGKTKEVVKDDPDCQKIADITGKIKDLKANATKDEINGIINDIDKAIENLDENNKTAQKKTLENLKTQLQSKLTTTTTPSSATPAASTATTATTPSTTGAGTGTTDGTGSTSAQTTASEPWSGETNWGDNSLNGKSVTLPTDYSKISDNDNIKEVKMTREIAGTMHDINGSSCQLSTDKVKKDGKDSNIPMYIAITSSESGKTFKYKYVGTTAEGNPVYATPASDKNNNVYVLAKKGNSFELIQLKGFSGHTRPDEQNG